MYHPQGYKTSCIQYLGIVIDSEIGEFCLPLEAHDLCYSISVLFRQAESHCGSDTIGPRPVGFLQELWQWAEFSIENCQLTLH